MTPSAKMRKAFNIAGSVTLGLFLAAASAVCMSNAPQKEGPPPPQTAQTAVVPAIPDDLKSYMNNPADAPEIAALKADFAKTALGIHILRFAQSRNIQFELDPTLAARHNKAEYSPATGKILIRPGLKSGGLVIYAAHELRHGWQDKVLHAITLEQRVLTPWQRWTLRRFLEADAEAFSAYFEADRLQNGLPMGPGFSEAKPAAGISLRLHNEFSSPNGLTYAEYRKLALEPSLSALFTYNAKQLDIVEDMTLVFGKSVTSAIGDKAKLAALEEMVTNAPDDAAFDAFLRRLGGVSFDVSAQTSLQSAAVTHETLTQVYPRLEANKDVRESFPPVLNKSIADMTALQESYIRVLHSFSGAKPAAPKPSS